jgi:hypothetical protein
VADVNQDSLRIALDGLGYPCGRGRVIEHAAAQGADDDMLGHLGSLPEQDYDGFDAVDTALAQA